MVGSTVIPMDEERSVDRAAEVLRGGGVVALPTDTVYGLLARASEAAAIERIFELKGRTTEKALPYLIPDEDTLLCFTNHVPGPARRLVRRFWPGALTLVLGTGKGVAVRMPDHPWLRDVLRRAGGLVCATSANRSGEDPATNIAGVVRAFPSGLDLAVDGGTSPGGQASAVVRVPEFGPAQILRSGPMPDASISQLGSFRVALVCTGNTCRSPMGAALLRSLLRQRFGADLADRDFRVESFGLAARSGDPMSAGAIAALTRAGLREEAHHRARTPNEVSLEEIDLFLAMTQDHVGALVSQFPETADRVRLIRPAAAIQDPYGGSAADYEACLSQLKAQLVALLDADLKR
jgi:protein-tyrosine phosphatase